MVSERQIQEAQPTQTSKYRQHAQNPRQEFGPDNEVALQECIESEKYQGDRGAPVIHLEKEQRQRLQLFRAEYTQVVRASQDEQGDLSTALSSNPSDNATLVMTGDHWEFVK